MDLVIFDHLDRREAPLGLAPVPGIFLAAATQRTRRIRLGPCVYCLPLYNPLRLIEEVCMLDQLSRGRFDFGVGRGIVPYEMAYFDLHHLETEEIYLEVLEVVLEGLTSDVLDHRGPRYTYRKVPERYRELWERKPDFDEARQRGIAIAGTPARVREEIEREIAASGCSYFVCRLMFGDMSEGEAAASIDLFTAEVMPHLAALAPPGA